MQLVNRRLLAAALTLSAAVVLSSPFAGELRGVIRASFPAQFPLIVSSAVAAAVALGLIVAIARMWTRSRAQPDSRLRVRIAGLGFALGGAFVYARLVATGNLEVDVVEHVHFVEYGLIAWLFYEACRPLGSGLAVIWPLLGGVLTGIIDEFVQWFIPARVGEAHDIFLNGVAVACGLCFAASVDPPPRFAVPLERQVIRPVAYGVSAVLLAFALFFQTVHLGHRLYEPSIGMFWSRYDDAGLMAASRDRAQRWPTDPPAVLRRLSREDQYLSEGLWHVQERNRAWGAGDPFTAWRENMLLERYFAPVLDARTYATPTPPRWPLQQRDDLAARVGSDPGFYMSRAAPYPIYTWSPVMFWSVVAAVIAAIVSAC